jgi:sodium-dependent phosphate cotransporter
MINARSSEGQWMKYEGAESKPDEQPSVIYPVYIKGNSVFIGRQMFLFNKPGFCWDGEDERGIYKACVSNVLSKFDIAGISFDSVYLFTFAYKNSERDSVTNHIYMSAGDKIILQSETTAGDTVLASEKLVGIEKVD